MLSQCIAVGPDVARGVLQFVAQLLGPERPVRRHPERVLVARGSEHVVAACLIRIAFEQQCRQVVRIDCQRLLERLKLAFCIPLTAAYACKRYPENRLRRVLVEPFPEFLLGRLQKAGTGQTQRRLQA